MNKDEIRIVSDMRRVALPREGLHTLYEDREHVPSSRTVKGGDVRSESHTWRCALPDSLCLGHLQGRTLRCKHSEKGTWSGRIAKPENSMVQSHQINSWRILSFFIRLFAWPTIGEVTVFWVIATCSLVEVYQRFIGPCCLHHQGDEAASTSETSVDFY
jgi:hypothetical protein